MDQGRKKRLWRVALLFAGVGAAAVAYLLLVRFVGFGIPCVFHELTGLLCPGCGLTRAMLALSRGQLSEALSYHPLLPLYAAYVGWFVGRATLRYIRGKEDPLWFGPARLHIAMLAVVLLFGVARNLW